MPLYKCFPCLKFQNDEVITKIDFSNTALTDVFPDVWQQERTLEELILTSTRINALPPQLFYCQSLRILAVNNNSLETIPNAVGSLRQLQHLNLSRNLLSSIPDNIKSCKHLTHLDLSCNNLQRLPDAITCLISLQELLLNETYLEFLPANFGRLVNLQILELRLNNLITLPKSLARLSNLLRIDIGGNEFTELPEVIGALKNLRELWIDLNQIRRISSNIANLRQLQHFEANGNLVESLPNEISHWRNIEVLSVCTNNLEALPFSMGMMKTLVTFKCESNQLRELPDSICNLENLEELVLGHNQLLRLPTTIGMLRKLRFIFVDGNELRMLPDEICNCSNLSVLSVSRNKITELPQNIGHLTKLKVLNIVDNYISTLPVSILSLINLTSLWISDNQSQPLVPLQFLDANTKTQLTCFMLPQAALGKQNTPQHNHNDEISIHDLSNMNPKRHLYKMQEEHTFGDNYSTEAHVTSISPSRRICFADEATIMTSTPQNVLSSLKGTDAVSTTSQDMSEPLAARLMRSPTPYPKELRLMAKYVRNSQRLTQKSPELLDVKEARVMSNSGCDTTVSMPKDAFINDAIAHSELQVANNNIQSADGTAYEDHTFQHFNPQQIQLSMQPNIDHNNVHVNQNASQQFYSTYCTSPQLAPQNTLFDSSDLQTYYLENWQQHTAPKDYYELYNIHQQRNLMEPPPYHIARVYTKKSPKDLNYYDTLRSQQNQTTYDDSCQLETPYPQMQGSQPQEPEHLGLLQIQNTTSTTMSMQPNETQSVDRCVGLRNDLAVTCQSRDVNIDNNSFSGFDHQNNIAGRLNQNSFVELQSFNSNDIKGNDSTASMGTMNVESLLDTNLHNETFHQLSEDNEAIVACNGNSNTFRSQSINRKTPWLFGVHKNPTVKQVTVRWENIVGFEIEKLHNQDGIFIASTTPSSCAANLLCIHDKLLEVDGFDFTNISITEALKIISNANSTINIMLSRK